MNAYHISKEFKSSKVFFPRIPRSRMSKENSTIPRICVATNIVNALRGYNALFIDDEFYVFKFTVEPFDCFIKWDKIAKFVVDSQWTRECWFLNKKRGTCIGKIKVLDFDFGNATNQFGEEYGSPINVKWQWIEKYC